MTCCLSVCLCERVDVSMYMWDSFVVGRALVEQAEIKQ